MNVGTAVMADGGDAPGAIVPGSIARGAAAPARALVTVAAAVAAALLFTGLLLAGVLVLVGRGEWWRGAVAATVASVMASVASVPIIAWGLRRGATRPDLSAAAFMVAAAVRAGVGLGAAVLAVKAGGYPKVPTLLLVVPYYFALLAAETAVLARTLWKTPPRPPTRAATSPAPSEHNHA